MLTLERAEDLRRKVAEWRGRDQRIGLVPTMGALHEGHLRLVDAARAHCDHVLATVFVNPLQFGPGEDIDRYPRDLERDRALLAERGVDLLFAPSTSQMYAPGFQTWVEPGPLAEPLCGATRPGHFRGVTTVVTKLFHLTAPHLAFFGQKDFQQVRVIERMVQDLEFDLRVCVIATVREADGLALSSRNQYLRDEDRRRAPVLHRALRAAERGFEVGERDPRELRQLGLAVLEREPDVRIEYFEVLHDETLSGTAALSDRGVVAGAIRLGSTRLIDNELLGSARSRLFLHSTEAAPR